MPMVSEMLNANQLRRLAHYKEIDPQARIVGLYKDRPLLHTHLAMPRFLARGAKRSLVILNKNGSPGGLPSQVEYHNVEAVPGVPYSELWALINDRRSWERSCGEALV